MRFSPLLLSALLPLFSLLPASSTGSPVHYCEQNGNGYAIGASALTAGTPVTEVTPSGRSLAFTQTTTFNGDDAGTLQFSNGTFLAATTNAENVTIRSDSSATGTVWALHFANNNFYLINRYATGQFNESAYLSGRNVLGDQLQLWPLNHTGSFQKLVPGC